MENWGEELRKISKRRGPVRLGVVGGRRGGALRPHVERLRDIVSLVALCDPDPDVQSEWKEHIPGISVFSRYDDLLADDGVEAVYIATPMLMHARQAVQALRAGKHVLSEVTAATTLDECWELVKVVRDSGLTYMMSENYCYAQTNMMVLNMVEKGCFGEISYAEGGYIHDTRPLTHRDDGSLTWRGEIHRDWNCTYYPTHSLGPLMQWMAINRQDRFRTLVSMNSQAMSLAGYFRDRFGKEHPGANRDYWKLGDSQTCLIQTERGAVVVLRVDSVSARPYNTLNFSLQGETAAFLSPRHFQEEPLVWIKGLRPPERSARPSQPTFDPEAPVRWYPINEFAPWFEHPRWTGLKNVHGPYDHTVWDLFVVFDFARSVLTGTRPPFDVVDAVTMSAVLPLSGQSVARGGEPVPFPDFRG